jgi:hypothetical protein
LRSVPTTRATKRDRRGTPSDTAHWHAAFHEVVWLVIEHPIPEFQYEASAERSISIERA